MAAPMVSGTAALMLQKVPSLTPDQVKARLMLTAFKGLQTASTTKDQTTGQVFNMQADLFTVGAGYLDIQAGAGEYGSACHPPRQRHVTGRQGWTAGNVLLAPSSSLIWGRIEHLGQRRGVGQHGPFGRQRAGAVHGVGHKLDQRQQRALGQQCEPSKRGLGHERSVGGRSGGSSDAEAASTADQP